MLDMLSFGLSSANLAMIGGAILAFFAWLWNTKRKARAEGAATERARTEAANQELVKDHADAQETVDRLPADDARRRLSGWSREP